MKKSLIYLFSLLCMLILVTSCSDDEKGGTDDAWKEISKDYTSDKLSIGTVSTSGTISVNAASADKATIILNNVVAGESSVSVDATLTKTDAGYAFEGESTATTCNVKVSGTIENGKLTAAISRTLTSALAGTLNLNYVPYMNGMQIAQAHAYFNTGDAQMDAMLNGMAAPVVGQLIAKEVESVTVNLGEEGTFSFSFKKVGASEETVMPPAKLQEMIKSYLTWYEKENVLYLAVHKDALTILSGLNILPENIDLETILGLLTVEGDYYTIPLQVKEEDGLTTIYLNKDILVKAWEVAKPLVGNIQDETIQSILAMVDQVMAKAKEIEFGLVFKK